MRLETARRHAQETYDKDLVTVQELELKLEIPSRWKPGDVEWQNAGRLVAQRTTWRVWLLPAYLNSEK